MTVTVLTSHLGYDLAGPKSAIVRVDKPGVECRATLESEDGTHIQLPVSTTVQVDAWHGGAYGRVDFDGVRVAGRYRLHVVADGDEASSAEFSIAEDRLIGSTLSDVLAYLRAMRSTGEIDRHDTQTQRYGHDAEPPVDARGGWLDASGDTSKFLSHLSYTPMMSPQQIPIVTWTLLEARDGLIRRNPRFAHILGAKLRDEALHGADFLTRFRSEEGYFFLGIFDALTKRLDERVINAPLPDCVRTDRYRASFRAGGGAAIAALARASTELEHGDFSSAQYLSAAIQAFDDLQRNNAAYLFGLDLETGDLTASSESIVDDYCALLAATELFSAAAEERFADAAHVRAEQLLARYQSTGWFIGDEAGRPYFHAVEPGLPVLALLRFAAVFPEAATSTRKAVIQIMTDLVERTDAVANPFGYPRQHASWTTGEERDTFFFPHANDTGYWWQGENAGISSFSAAASKVAELRECPPQLATRLRRLAGDQLHWILGRNPFDACMLQGRGQGNAEYSAEFPNLPGGIVNGITSGFENERDIAFMPTIPPLGDHAWRWSEQWIPHTAWFALAVACASGTQPDDSRLRDWVETH